jgi:hypothetical protein
VSVCLGVWKNNHQSCNGQLAPPKQILFNNLLLLEEHP